MLHYRLLLAAPIGAHDVDQKIKLAWALWLHRKGLINRPQPSLPEPPLGMQRLDSETIQTYTVSSTGAFRLRIFETKDTGRWTSTLTWVPTAGPASAGLGMSGWVEATVELDQSALLDPPAVPFKPPGLGLILLGIADWQDLRKPVKHAIEVDRNRAAQLADFIRDGRRKLPAVVCSPPIDGSYQSWRESLLTLAAHVQGVATVWVLDQPAQTKLTDILGHGLHVWGGAIRTYVPNLLGSLEGVADSRAVHKVLRWEHLRDAPELGARIIASSCRDALLDATPWTPAPKSLDTLVIDIEAVPSLAANPALAANRNFARTELASTVAELEQARSLIDGLVAEAAMLREAAAAASAQADLAVELGATAEAELQATRVVLREADEEAALRFEELEEARRAERNLKLALAARSTPTATEVIDPLRDPAEDYSPPPSSFDELLEYLELMPEIEFTGDRAGPEHLWQTQNRRTILSKTWETALAMAAYSRAVRANRFSGTFHRWCDAEDDPVVTRRLTTAKPDGGGRVASGESTTVQNNDEMRRRRVFPVPKSVDARGETEMFAHVKLGVGSTFPRLHFIEHTGTVYVGYIGPHLPNTKT